MIQTLAIHGSSSGNVMAPVPAGVAGEFIPGTPRMILITAIDPDEDTPLSVRKALIGVRVKTMSTGDQLGKGFADVMPTGSLAAYLEDTVEALRSAGKTEAADELWTLCPQPTSLYVFKPGIYELVG